MRRWLPSRLERMLGHLTPTQAMTDNFWVTPRRSIELEAGQADALRELDRLRSQVEELRAARMRLVLDADAERRALERELHDGVHQHLVALAVSVQLIHHALDSDPAAARAQLEDLGRDIEHALQETARLAQRLHPATLESRQLAALLRAAAVNAGVPASVDAALYSRFPPELTMTIYLFWHEALAGASGETRVSISVREEDGALAFDVTGSVARSEADLERLRDRVEALGGRLSTDGGRVSGSLPLQR